MSLFKDFDHLRIQLQEIITATDNFCKSKQIGRGGFGPVYKGELCGQEGQRTVAFKRLDPKFGQGNTEFWKEIMMLSKLKHENLISLLHFCIEGNERILVYEYASRGSLDRYLSDACLTWTERLMICVQAARAINYLHDPKETQQRVLHRDIKSSNILLDENWTAKISDFGLAKIGLANQPQTYVVSNAVGTIGYLDPVYYKTGFLSKESDVYSFGVVLFEVMCGRLCYEYREKKQQHILVPSWKNSFMEKKLDDIIFVALKGQIDEDCLKTFSTIAYHCLNKEPKERPMMMEVVNELEAALEQQLNSSSISIPENVKSRIIGHGVHRSGYVRRIRPQHMLKAEITKITYKEGLVDSEGVKKLIQLMEDERSEKGFDFSCRIMLVNVVSFTRNTNCLKMFTDSGLSVLDGWLQEFQKAKEINNKSADEFLFVLLRVLDMLPVTFRDRSKCNIRESINDLQNHENPEIQKMAKNLLDKWSGRGIKLRF